MHKMSVAAMMAAVMIDMCVCENHLFETMEFLNVEPNKQGNSGKSFQIKNPAQSPGFGKILICKYLLKDNRLNKSSIRGSNLHIRDYGSGLSVFNWINRDLICSLKKAYK